MSDDGYRSIGIPGHVAKYLQTVSTFALPSDFYKGAIAKRPDSCGDMSLKTACLFRRLRSIGCHEITFPFVSPHGFKGSSRAASGAGCRSMHPS